MKLKFTLLSVVALICSTGKAYSQSPVTTVSANNNSYSVHFRLTPVSLVTPTNCGPAQGNQYNYNVNIEYEISFTGSVPSNALNTLQGTVDCGANTGIFFNLPLVADTGISTSSVTTRNATDCQTATPNSIGCNSMSIQINGKQISNQTISYSPSPLPVEMTFLYLSNEMGMADITWGTASEKDNDYFEVQRSLDGTNWEAIGRVEGNGTTLVGAKYAYTDAAPFQGISYYRLKQVDFDGTYDYSDVLVSRIGVNANLPTRVYPNPTKDKVTVEGVSLTDNIAIINAVGQNITSEVNLNSTGKNMEFDLSNVPTGIYFVQTATETYKIYKH